MSDKSETIPDIIADHRQRAKEILGNGVYEDILEKEEAEDAALDHEIEADRIEAAYKREMGNMQKMREALEKVKEIIDIVPLPPEIDCRLEPQEVGEAVGIIDKALSAPARNCDKYATHNDAMQAFDAFVREQGKLGFINPYTEAFKWLFAPATKQEGESNEQK